MTWISYRTTTPNTLGGNHNHTKKILVQPALEVVRALGLLGGFVFLMVTLLFGAMKKSEAYRVALETAQAHSEVQAALGTPVEDGLIFSGNINVTPTSGDADFAIPIKGPQAKGTLFAVASKSAGKWTFSTLEVQVSGTAETDRITLLK